MSPSLSIISQYQVITLTIMKMRAGIQKCRFLAFSLCTGSHFWQTINSFWSKQEHSLLWFLCSSHITAPQPCFLNKMYAWHRYFASFIQSGSLHGLTLNSGSSTSREFSPTPLISTSVPPVACFLAIWSRSEKPPAPIYVCYRFSSSSPSSF